MAVKIFEGFLNFSVGEQWEKWFLNGQHNIYTKISKIDILFITPSFLLGIRKIFLLSYWFKMNSLTLKCEA